MIKPSKRAAAIAACFALGLSAVGPAAHAALLGGSDGSDSMAVEGLALPVGGDLLGGLLGGGGLPLVGGLLGGGGGGLPLVGEILGGGGLPIVGEVLNGSTGGGLLGGDLLGSLPLVGGLLGGGGGLPLVGDVLGGGGLPLVGDVLGGGGGLPLVGGLLSEDGVLGGEMLDVVTDTTLSCDAAIPQVLRTFIGEVTDAICEPFSYGLFGLLGSL